MELRAGLAQKKGNRRGPAYAYNVKELREREADLARRAERSYEQFVARWKSRPPRTRRARRPLPEGPSKRRLAQDGPTKPTQPAARCATPEASRAASPWL